MRRIWYPCARSRSSDGKLRRVRPFRVERTAEERSNGDEVDDGGDDHGNQLKARPEVDMLEVDLLDGAVTRLDVQDGTLQQDGLVQFRLDRVGHILKESTCVTKRPSTDNLFPR